MKSNNSTSYNFVKSKLKTNKYWAKKALVSIFNNQTTEEKTNNTSVEKNGLGFNKYDSRILCPMTKIALSKRKFSEKQFQILFDRLPKYTNQFISLVDQKWLDTCISNEKEKIN